MKPEDKFGFVVRYDATEYDPDSEPSEDDGEPGGAGPPEDAGPPSHVQDLLESTPASTDERLHPHSRAYDVRDTIDPDTGNRRIRGILPFERLADAVDDFDVINASLDGFDSYTCEIAVKPVRGYRRSDVTAFFDAYPEFKPDEDSDSTFLVVDDPDELVSDDE